MYSLNQFRQEKLEFVNKTDLIPTNVHLSKKQQVDLVNEARMFSGQSPDYMNVPRVEHVEGVKCHTSEWDGPHFSALPKI